MALVLISFLVAPTIIHRPVITTETPILMTVHVYTRDALTHRRSTLIHWQDATMVLARITDMDVLIITLLPAIMMVPRTLMMVLVCMQVALIHLH